MQTWPNSDFPQVEEKDAAAEIRGPMMISPLHEELSFVPSEMAGPLNSMQPWYLLDCRKHCKEPLQLM